MRRCSDFSLPNDLPAPVPIAADYDSGAAELNITFDQDLEPSFGWLPSSFRVKGTGSDAIGFEIDGFAGPVLTIGCVPPGTPAAPLTTDFSGAAGMLKGTNGVAVEPFVGFPTDEA